MIAARHAGIATPARVTQVRSLGRSLLAGLGGGLVGNIVLAILFANPITQSILYDPALQSRLFIDITPQRNIPVSVAGLVILSAAHGWLYAQFAPSIPGFTWVRKGLFWGLTIWLMFWVFQEWFIYRTLLGEPIALNLFELVLLLCGSLAEGLVIAFCLRSREPAVATPTPTEAALTHG